MELLKKKAITLDQHDSLQQYRSEFYLPSDSIYFDGNSLGLCSKRAESSLQQIMDTWQKYGIDGWLKEKHPWFYLAEEVGAKMAPLVGAADYEVVATNSTTVNLHQLISTFYPNTKKILTDELSFPTDMYALQSQLQLHGTSSNNLRLVKSREGLTLDEEDIIAEMKRDIGLIILPTVLYRSGQLLDIPRITSEAQQRGIVIGWDACHSIGVIPHELHKWGVDFAVWCTYKYLNGGPGSVAGLFVHEKHHHKIPGLTGWFGSDKELQFEMSHKFTPSGDAGSFQIGTPHILSMAPLLGSLEIFEEATIMAIRQKSLMLTQFMIECINEALDSTVFSFANPLEFKRRGGHVSLIHNDANRICKALKESGVIADFRYPNIIRLAPIALYTSFNEVWKAISSLKSIMQEKTYQEFSHEREVII